MNCPKCNSELSLWFSDYESKMVRYCRGLCGYKEVKQTKSRLITDNGQLASIYDIKKWTDSHYEKFTLISHGEIINQIIKASKKVEK